MSAAAAEPDEDVYIGFKGPRDLRDAAKRLAIDEGRNVKEILHDAIAEYLERHGYYLPEP